MNHDQDDVEDDQDNDDDDDRGRVDGERKSWWRRMRAGVAAAAAAAAVVPMGRSVGVVVAWWRSSSSWWLPVLRVRVLVVVVRELEEEPGEREDGVGVMQDWAGTTVDPSEAPHNNMQADLVVAVVVVPLGYP